MATGQQLVMIETIPGAYWVEITNHGTIATGTCYLVVSEWGADDWLVCWRDGIKPKHNGTLLLPRHVRKVE